MAGLVVQAIHVLMLLKKKDVEARPKARHDELGVTALRLWVGTLE
jgi:hypothetical protein